MTYTSVTSTARKPDRLQFEHDLRAAVTAHCPAAVIEYVEHDHSDRSMRCRVEVPGALGVSFWLEAGERDRLLSWHGARSRLQGVDGAWLSFNINRFHGCKASTLVHDLNSLIGCLIAGLNAAADGSAFAPVAANA